MNLLERVWEPAKLSLEKEKVALAEAMEALPSDQRFEIEAWDWRYLAEKVRVSKFDIDEATLKPYFPLHRMLAALFDCAKQLFGLTFTLRPDLQTYHPDVLAYEVTEAVMQEGGPKDITVAIFLQG